MVAPVSTAYSGPHLRGQCSIATTRACEHEQRAHHLYARIPATITTSSAVGRTLKTIELHPGTANPHEGFHSTWSARSAREPQR